MQHHPLRLKQQIEVDHDEKSYARRQSNIAEW